MQKLMIVVQLEQLQGTHGEARKDGPLSNHIWGMLVRYKGVLTNMLLKKSPPRSGMQLCSVRDWVLELCGDQWSWWMDMTMVKASDPWCKMGLGYCLAYPTATTASFEIFKVAKTLFDLLEKWVSQEWDEPCHQACGELKRALFSPLVLKFEIFDNPFEAHTGASYLPLVDVDARWMAIAYEIMKLGGCPTLSDVLK